MNIYRLAPGQVLFEGTNFTRRMVLDRVRELLEEKGIHPIEAEGAIIDNHPPKVALAWWDEEAGFVQEDYEGATAVTVVSVPDDPRVFDDPRVTRNRRRNGNGNDNIS